ncbi:P-loop containing nucleoside triphosphate hydrolase protein [Lactarius tabidus]
MRLALARALFVKPAPLLLDEPSNHIHLNALAWLEDYLQTWPGTLIVVSHDRVFPDAFAKDIIHQRSGRLDYYKGGNFTEFYSTKSERERNLRREYETQMEYRKHLQAFIDRWRYNANRAAQAQSEINILEKLPELSPPTAEETESFRFPETEKISPPLLQLSEVTFGGYDPAKIILNRANFDVGLDSRLVIVGSNGAGKSTFIKLLTGELAPLSGQVNRNGSGYFAQHHEDGTRIPPAPGQLPDHRDDGIAVHRHPEWWPKIARCVCCAIVQRPHILLLDEPTNHLDLEGLDALMLVLNTWNGGVIIIFHHKCFITSVAKELWVCGDDAVTKFMGDDVTCRLTKRVGSSSQPGTPLAFIYFHGPELDYQEHQSKTLSWLSNFCTHV